MHILTTSTESQSIGVIPRRNVSGYLNIVIIDESTGDVVEDTTDVVWNTYNVNFSLANQDWNDDAGLSYTEGETYLTISFPFTLTEGNYYVLKLNDSDGNIYIGKIFCTDQTVDQDTNNYYSINSGEYVSDTTYDNDYIIL